VSEWGCRWWGGMATIGEVHGGVDTFGWISGDFWGGGSNVRGLREDRED